MATPMSWTCFSLSPALVPVLVLASAIGSRCAQTTPSAVSPSSPQTRPSATKSSKPVVIAQLTYRTGVGDSSPDRPILRLTSDGLLTVAAGWPNGSGDRVTYRLDEDELALIVDRLRWTFDRAGDLEPVYHAAKEDHLVLRVRVDGRLFYMHCSQFIDWDPRFGGERWQEVYRYRLIWHAFKDILEQMVIEAAFRDHGQLPARTRAATSQPTTRRSQPLVALAYSSGAMPSPDAPRSAGVLELWEDGRLIVSPDWHCGAGERMLFHLTEVQVSGLIAGLKQPVEAAGPLKAPMDFGHHSSYHSLRIRAGSVRFDMLTAQPWHLTDPPHSEDSQKWRETYRNRVLWHELKDVLQHAVIDIVLPEAVKPE